jgi:23S rRNA (cytidine1920-2'-O)/16S rRNA (cytidine1409-2'-O)-methyltransferase
VDTPRSEFVSRGGLKLRNALDAFGVSVAGLRCADFGANVGGFTDCLLKAGAAHITAVDTGYGTLAWTLRNDPRVRVMERTNALHAEPPQGESFDLIVIDMGWTPQRLCIPAAIKWLGETQTGRIISLIKPHYETSTSEKALLHDGVLSEPDAERIAARALAEMSGLGATVIASTLSPIVGGTTKGNTAGNREWLALLQPALS